MYNITTNHQMNNSIYTMSERTVRKYTVGQAVESAKRRMHGADLCINTIRSRAKNEKITLEEMNQIIEELVSDSNYYN